MINADGATEAELREVCRNRLEMLESWLRRLIDQRFSEVFGNNVLLARRVGGDFVVKSSTREAIAKKLTSEPTRYKRPVDATTLEEAIGIICNPETFRNCFKEPLATAFPQGNSEARDFLSRLIDPRNRLSHGNSISMRQAEQVACYSGDVIASIRSYYERMGSGSEFNVPRIIRYWDSLGNVIHADLSQAGLNQVIIPKTPENELRPGDVLIIDIDVDPSFIAEGFTVKWRFPNNSIYSGEQLTKVSVTLENKHVAEHAIVTIEVCSHRDWHRMVYNDDVWEVFYRILPPL